DRLQVGLVEDGAGPPGRGPGRSILLGHCVNCSRPLGSRRGAAAQGEVAGGEAEAFVEGARTGVLGGDLEGERDRAGWVWCGMGGQRFEQRGGVALAARGGLDIELVDGADVTAELVRPVGDEESVAGGPAVELEHRRTP